MPLQDIQNCEAPHDDQENEQDLPELLANVMIIELEPDRSNADYRPDASTCSSANLVRLENRRQHIALVRTQAEDQYEFLPRPDLLFNCEANEEKPQDIVHELEESRVEESGGQQAPDLIVFNDVIGIFCAKKVQSTHPDLWIALRVAHDNYVQDFCKDEYAYKDRSEEERHRLELEVRKEDVQALHAAILMLLSRPKREAGALESTAVATSISFVEIREGHHSRHIFVDNILLKFE